MTSTGLNPKPLATLAVGMTAMGPDHDRTPTLHPAPGATEGYGSPAGGLFSTTTDMKRFAEALAANRLTHPATTTAMTTFQIVAALATASRPERRYGLGFNVGLEQGHRWFGHGGGTPGANAEFAVFPRSPDPHRPGQPRPADGDDDVRLSQTPGARPRAPTNLRRSQGIETAADFAHPSGNDANRESGMFSHVMIGTNNLDKAAFYDKVLGVLGVPPHFQDRHRIFYRHKDNTFSVSQPINGEPASAPNGGTLGRHRERRHGEDPPGVRARLKDPDGNKLCALHRM